MVNRHCLKENTAVIAKIIMTQLLQLTVDLFMWLQTQNASGQAHTGPLHCDS